jgi:CTP synthase
LEQEGLAQRTLELLQLEQRQPDLENWRNLVIKMNSSRTTVEVAIVGKYIRLSDAYLSVVEALGHGAIAADCEVNIRWVNAEDIELYGAAKYLNDISGVIVPGGFGIRGVHGKVAAIEYARTAKIPFLGLCLGMQCCAIEWGRNVAKLQNANSSEFDPDSPNPIINILPEQQDVIDLGGTMRLGTYPCRLKPNTIAYSLYQNEVIYERHRHRYEFNNAYRSLFLETGYEISGTSPDGRLVEIIEMPDHPFFIATQFHPEFRSRPNNPHPLFLGFVQAALKQNKHIDEASIKISTPTL